MSTVFIHVPRTGGNSILPHLVDKKTHIVHHVEKVDLDEFKGSWVFSFMRDPCQRVISAYAYLRNGGRSSDDEQDGKKYVCPFADLEDFVLHGMKKASEEQRHFRPQHYWLTNAEGKLVTNFLGRTERLQQDFDRVSNACGWETVKLGTLNESQREGLVCTPAMRGVIQDVYAEDYRLLQNLESTLASGLMGRILSVFNRHFPSEKRDIVWNECINISSKVELSEFNLENMCTTNLVRGFGGGGGAKELKWLSEALGIAGIQNKENNDYHNAIIFPPTNVEGLTPDQILDKIQDVLPFKIEFPPFSGNCQQGLQTKYGVTANRHIYYLWVLKRILELCPDRNTGIIEIGAGFGVLGYYLDRVGYRDYTTIDLALINACQTYFLAKNLPERNIILSGDVPDPFDLKHKDSIKLLHATDFKDVPENRFGIMINMDGLTEYGQTEAEKYVQSNCAPILFSINHEVNQYRVCELNQPHRKRSYRNLFWMRPGYVEELYV